MTWGTGSLAAGVTEGLRGVSCASSAVCTAVGDFGHIVRTGNGGANWGTRQTLPALTNPSLLGVGCVSTTQCVAVGDEGGNRLVLRTTNSGTTWTKITVTPSGFPLADVDCPAGTTTCVAVGYGGKIIRSTDGGLTWTADSPPPAYDLLGVSCISASTCVAVDNGGFILRYASSAWTKVATATDSFTSVSCSGTLCFAAGYRGLRMRSTDSGATWSTVSSTASDAFGVSCTPRRCRNVGLAGRIQKI